MNFNVPFPRLATAIKFITIPTKKNKTKNDNWFGIAIYYSI